MKFSMLTDAELFNVIHGAIQELRREDLTAEERDWVEQRYSECMSEASKRGSEFLAALDRAN
ncbi:MAG: hypothetical protein E5V48_02535 [Mesorhizobium sp.]|nr:MAG: hypothetical protein E5V48_02535 [Mesorhizobium sp.]